VKLSLDTLSRIRLRSGSGVFEHDGVVHRVEVAKTPFGMSRVEGEGIEILELVSSRVRSILRNAIVRLPARYLSRLPNVWSRAATEDASAKAKPRVRPAVVGVRASAVTLHSETVEETHSGQTAAHSDRDERGGKGERRPTRVLEDSVVFVVGKKKVRLTVRARVDELQAITAATGLDAQDGHCFEPAPWAVWRASHHIAPIKTTQGLHLRFVLGEAGGIAILATNKRPLAWHVLSWDDAPRVEVLVQAFHLLRIHAVRRLHLAEVAQVSLQGEPFATECRNELQAAIELPVDVVEGDVYGGDLVAFGLAIGAVEPQADAFNLARSLQPPATILQLVPWGEAAFMMSLFVCMYLVLHFNLSSMRDRLHVAAQQVQSVTWANGVAQPKLKDEADALKREVEPLKQFLSRDLSFGQALSTVASTVPGKVWLTTVTGEDLLWEKNSNKTLGNRYILLTAGAPSEREGMAPPEVSDTVRRLEQDALFRKVLPHVKLADVNWHRENGYGYTVFSVLAVAQEVTK